MAMRSLQVAGRATNSLEFQTQERAAPFRRFFCWTLSLVTATLVFQTVAPSRAQALISRNRSARKHGRSWF